jgi:hypothetical protein
MYRPSPTNNKNVTVKRVHTSGAVQFLHHQKKRSTSTAHHSLHLGGGRVAEFRADLYSIPEDEERCKAKMNLRRMKTKTNHRRPDGARTHHRAQHRRCHAFTSEEFDAILENLTSTQIVV